MVISKSLCYNKVKNFILRSSYRNKERTGFEMDGFFAKVKSNFGRAKDEASKYSKLAIQKTSNLVSQTKYNFAVNDAENKIITLMAEIGEYVYTEYLDGSEFPAEVAAKCADIDSLKEEIASLKDKIADLKDAVVCPACGEYNNNENIYCAKCGEKLRTVAVEVEPEAQTEQDDSSDEN